MILINRSNNLRLFEFGNAVVGQKKVDVLLDGWKEHGSREWIKLSFPEEKQSFFRPLLKELHTLFKGKCAFCECRLQASDTDVLTRVAELLYFRPITRKGNVVPNYFWLSWQWPNMYLSCKPCAEFYKKEFPRSFPIQGQYAKLGVYEIEKLNDGERPFFIDPCFDNPAKFLNFIVKDGLVQIEAANERGQETIKAFGLCRGELGRARADVNKQFKDHFEQALGLVDGLEFEEILVEIQNLIQECEADKEFAGMKRFFLQKWLDAHEGETSGEGWQAVRKQLEAWREETAVSSQPYPPPTDPILLPPPPFPEKPNINLVKIFNKMQDEEPVIILKLILKKMFPKVDEVIVKGVFNTGFSGAQLFHVQPKEGRRSQLPRVVKIDRDHKIEIEFEKGNSIKNFVPDAIAPLGSIEKSGMGWSGIQYQLSGDGKTNIMSLKQYLMKASLENIALVFEEELFGTMKRFWSKQAEDDYFWRKYDAVLPANLEIEYVSQANNVDFKLTPYNLLQSLPKVEAGDYVKLSSFTHIQIEDNELNFNLSDQTGRLKMIIPKMELIEQNMRHPSKVFYGKVVKTRYSILLEKILQAYKRNGLEKFDANIKHVILPDQTQITNPLLKIDEMLNDHSDVYISNLIHGDLNLENVLVEYHSNNYPKGIALIDFATIRENDHILHDFLRLETSIWLYIVSEELEKNNLSQQVGSLFHAVYQKTEVGNEYAHLKSYHILKAIRQKVDDERYLMRKDGWGEYFRGLALYMLGALKYDNLDAIKTNPSPKLLAFWVACLAYHYVEHGGFDGLVGDDSPPDDEPSAPAETQTPKENHSLKKEAPPTMNTESEKMFLHDQIDKYFNKDELKEMCVEIGVDYENIRGGTRKVKVIELILYCKRHGKMLQLLTYCKNEYPLYNWDNFQY